MSSAATVAARTDSGAAVTLDRDTFMRRLIASLGHLNEGILGSDVAGAYVMNVGLSMGAAIEAEYKRAWGVDRPFTLDEYARVIVDLKQKIQGNFSLVSRSEEKVVVQTTSCPFDEFVRQSPSLCFMTSSVFGGIAARNFGFGKVVLHRRIALGDDGCYVTVYLKRTPEAEAAVGKEYAPDVEQASPDLAQQLRLMDSVRRLRQELGETTSRWEEVVRGASDAICVLDPDGRITFANARWRDLLGVEADELTGGSFERVVHPADQASLREVLEEVRAGRRVATAPWRLRHRDGTWREVVASTGPVRDERGAAVGAIGIFRDVTAEREAQRLKDEFLSTASHELRTPVTSIKSLTQLLLRTVAREGSVEPAQLEQRLRQIQAEADRMATMSADLLDVARPQTGALPSRRSEEDLNQVVAESLSRMRALLGDTARHTATFVRPTGALPVQVERPRIERALANLLDNAAKYSPDGGEITVRTAAAGGWARVEVQDRGVGIPEQDLPKLFTPFFRASNVSARNFPGLGLGLHLAKASVEAHGGTLTVSSVEGRGTTFTLSLPLAAGRER